MSGMSLQPTIPAPDIERKTSKILAAQKHFWA
jgi:hypothetical protein